MTCTALARRSSLLAGCAVLAGGRRRRAPTPSRPSPASTRSRAPPATRRSRASSRSARSSPAAASAWRTRRKEPLARDLRRRRPAAQARPRRPARGAHRRLRPRTRRTPRPRPTSSGRGSLKLLSGGPITEKISYYFYVILEQGESVKLEDTFVQFNSLFGLPVDLMVGQFQVCDPLFKRELRLERNDYAIFKTRVGVAADQPHLRPRPRPHLARPGRGRGHRAGRQRQRHRAGGGRQLRRRQLQEHGAAPGRASSGRCASALFGYWGKEELDDGPSTASPTSAPTSSSTSARSGSSTLEYLERTRRRSVPRSARTGPDVDDRGRLRRAALPPGGPDGRWAIAALYNKVDSDVLESQAENVSLTLSYLLARNMRANGEIYHDLDLDDDRVSFGLIAAF